MDKSKLTSHRKKSWLSIVEHFMKYIMKYIIKIEVWDFHLDEAESIAVVVILEDCINVSSPSTLNILS